MSHATLPTAHELVARLGLVPHPEGGYYRETHRSALVLDTPTEAFGGPRAASTAIYYLLGRDDFSALHRIASDEVWHHYLGATLTVHVLAPDGEHRALRVGIDLASGAMPQAVVPAGSWFGARIEPDDAGDYALVGCTVSPGFDFAEFEMGSREALLRSHSSHEAWIRALTRC